LLSHTAKERFVVTRLVSKQNKKIQNIPLFLGDMAGLIKTSKQRKQEELKENENGDNDSNNSGSSFADYVRPPAFEFFFFSPSENL